MGIEPGTQQSEPVDAVNEARDDVGGLIAALPRQTRHDLRSCIGRVIGYTELWLDETTEADAVTDWESLRRDLERMREAGQQILDIVNRYVDPIVMHERPDGHMVPDLAVARVARERVQLADGIHAAQPESLPEQGKAGD
jgi:signal transduction histidine kinase